MKYNIITIEREYASGGREIGFKTSEKLGIPCYGIEILEMVAEKYGVSIDLLYELEENTTNSLLYSIGLMSSSTPSDFINGRTGLSNTDALFLAETNIIKELATKGPCIIIGHCAGSIFPERKDVLRLFVHSDLKSKKARAIEKYRLSDKGIESALRKIDKRRSNYYNAHSNTRWNDCSGYHLMLNSGKLGIESCVDIISKLANNDS